MKIIAAFILSLLCIQLYACNTDKTSKPIKNSNSITNADPMKLKITIGTNVFIATCYDNATAKAFKKMLPMTINMTELNGDEKYYDLPEKLPTNASNLRTIETGDLMLFGSNTLVLFYKQFSPSYSYTKVGRIENPSGLASALGSGNVTVTFEMELNTME